MTAALPTLYLKLSRYVLFGFGCSFAALNTEWNF